MKVFILSGEISGDNYAALLIRQLKHISSDIEIFATGGERVKKQDVEIIKGIPSGYMGYSSIIFQIPSYLNSLRKVTQQIENINPDIVVFIDNPGFNLKVAERIGNLKCIKVYYIPPKIWAHGYERVRKIKKYIDVVIPIFPFEKEIYEKERIQYRYFGHPVVDLLEEYENVSENTENKEITIGILPGSRIQEVYYVFPEILKVIKRLKEKMDFKVFVSAVNEEIEKLLIRQINFKETGYEIFKGHPGYLIKNSDLILATSGTVNLEVALMFKPLVVFYKTSLLNYFIGKLVVKLEMISPVNLFLGEKVVPEYVQRIPEEEVKNEIMELLTKGEKYRRQIEKFKQLKEKAGEKGVSKKIAEFLIGLKK